MTNEKVLLDYASRRRTSAHYAVTEWAESLINSDDRQYTMEWAENVYRQAAEEKAWATVQTLLNDGKTCAEVEAYLIRIVLGGGQSVKAGDPRYYAEASLQAAFVRIAEFVRSQND